MNTQQPTVRIWHENLAAEFADKRRPLSELTADCHIHGGLRLEVAGRLVPYLGYFGPDDACFGQWLVELQQAARAMQRPGGRHVFDEGEQGQPAFVFEREADRGFFTIAAAEFSGGQADPDWQRIEFIPADFVSACENFRASFVAEVRASAPDAWEAWLARLPQGPAKA